VAGFAAVLAGVPTAPAVGHALLCVGAMVLTHKSVVLTRKELANAAMRHVERIVVLPAEGSGRVDEAAVDDQATVAERLRATPEVRLLVETTNLELRLTLCEQAAAWEGAKYSGLVVDERPPFGALPEVLYIDAARARDEADGEVVSEDPELLAAILRSGKVIGERTVESRLEEGSLVSAPRGVDKHLDALLAAAVKERPSTRSGAIESEGAPFVIPRRLPAEDIRQIGVHTLLSGLVFLSGGCAVMGRWLRERDGGEPGLAEAWRQRLAEGGVRLKAPGTVAAQAAQEGS